MQVTENLQGRRNNAGDDAVDSRGAAARSRHTMQCIAYAQPDGVATRRQPGARRRPWADGKKKPGQHVPAYIDYIYILYGFILLYWIRNFFPFFHQYMNKCMIVWRRLEFFPKIYSIP